MQVHTERESCPQLSTRFRAMPISHREQYRDWLYIIYHMLHCYAGVHTVQYMSRVPIGIPTRLQFNAREIDIYVTYVPLVSLRCIPVSLQCITLPSSSFASWEFMGMICMIFLVLVHSKAPTCWARAANLNMANLSYATLFLPSGTYQLLPYRTRLQLVLVPRLEATATVDALST
ncbi:hypothetical protein DFH27DRAFT_111062 [Peziza echinospora]|nr:hypothetical protein DFH27DRAFT_111062 [Peziza echinospora]